MHPVLLKIGPVKIYSYGFFVAISFYIGYLILKRNSRIFKIEKKHIDEILSYLLIYGLIGSRIFYFIFWDFETLLSHPYEFLFIWKGGLSIFGSIFGGLIGIIHFSKRKRIDIKNLLDLVATALPLSQAIGRIGCLFAGCCYGKETDFFLHIKFKNPHSLAPLNVPLHPVQIYEMFFDFLIFLYLNRLKLKRKYNGEITLNYFILYPVVRFFLEFIRGDAVYFSFFPYLSKMQILCIISVTISFFLMKRWKKLK